MAEHDYDIANASASTVRGDLNNVFAAIISKNSKATTPSTTFAHMWWYDTATNLLKQRSAADDAWIVVGKFDQSNNLFIPDFNGLSFSDLDLIHHDGTDFARLAVGTALQQLRVNAGATALEWTDPGGVSPTKQIFNASGTWNKPSGCVWVKVSVTAGGDGGDDVDNGGLGAPTSIKWIDVTSISSSTITVGPGGVGSTTSTNNPGGFSRWADGTNTVQATGGSVSVATGGDIHTGRGLPAGAKGGGTIWGPSGGDAGSNNGITPGSGGGGTPGGGTGGNGRKGVVVVEEFY